MTSPFASLARPVGSALRNMFFPATLTRAGPTTGPDYDPTPGVESVYPCRAYDDDCTDFQRANGLVLAGDRNVMILASGLAVTPEPGDCVSVRGKTFTIISVRDRSASALWEAQGRV